MSDITMCATIACPKMDECYRIQAEPSEWQSWSDFYSEEVQKSKPFKCEHFMRILKK